jgi:diaminopimelate epimerase
MQIHISDLGVCHINHIVCFVQASARGGIVNIHLDEQNQRVLMQGKAVSVMEGSLLV